MRTSNNSHKKYIVSHKWSSRAGTFTDAACTWKSEDAAKYYIERLLRRHGMSEKELSSVVKKTLDRARIKHNARIGVEEADYNFYITLKVREH